MNTAEQFMAAFVAGLMSEKIVESQDGDDPEGKMGWFIPPDLKADLEHFIPIDIDELKNTCMCGDSMDTHGGDPTHTPLSQFDYMNREPDNGGG